MKKLSTTLTLIGMLFAATPALADEPLRPTYRTRSDGYREPERRDDRYHQRSDRRHYRRDDRDRRYSRWEQEHRARLAQEQAYLWELERRAWADGFVSAYERERINRARYALSLRQQERWHDDRDWR